MAQPLIFWNPRGPARRKTTKTAKTAKRKSSAAKSLSKKVGRHRVSCKGRTVHCGGAKHAYKDSAAACAVYKRIGSEAACKRFIERYGAKKTKRAAGVVKAKKTRRNPSGRLAPVKAYGNHSIRIDGTQLTAYARGGAKLASHYYSSEGTAQAAWRGIRSEQGIRRFVDRYGSTRKNPCGTRRRPAKRSRRNPPISSAEAATLKRILMRHGYRP